MEEMKREEEAAKRKKDEVEEASGKARTAFCLFAMCYW